MDRLAGLGEPPDLLGDAVHVDGEADAAIADQGDPQLLLPHAAKRGRKALRCRAGRAIFRRSGSLRRGNRYGNEPGGRSGFPGPVSSRRFLIIIIVALSFVALLWGALAYWSTPATESPQPPTARFDDAGGERRDARKASNVDYARLDARLQRLMDEPGDGRPRRRRGRGWRDPLPQGLWRDRRRRRRAGDPGHRVPLGLAVQGRRRRHGRPARRTRGGCRWTSRSTATPPRCACPAATRQSATVADLLSHRLGLFGHAQDSKLEDGMDPRFLRASLATLHNICSPGTCHAYQNVAYDAASEIVERVTGQPYGEVRARAPLRAARDDRRKHQPRRPDALAELGAAACRRRAAARSRSTTSITGCRPRAGSTARSRISPSGCWRRWASRRTSCRRRVLAAVQTPRVRTPGENFRRRKFRERTADLRLRARLAGARLCRPPGRSAIMAGCAATAR